VIEFYQVLKVMCCFKQGFCLSWWPWWKQLTRNKEVERWPGKTIIWECLYTPGL